MVEYLKTLWLVDTKQNKLMAYKTEDMSLINSYDFLCCQIYWVNAILQ